MNFSRWFGSLSLAVLWLPTAIAQDPAPASPNPTSHVDPSQLEYSRFSGDINVPDPVAISLDNEGTAYVTQTQRRKSQDLDIRNNSDWIPNDVGFQSVEDKRRFYHDRLAPSKDQDRNHQRVADLNRDGSHDWHDLTMISERIHWLRDTDGDGTADASGIYAEGFQTEVTGIAAGVLWHQGDVYTTIAPDVWKLRDTDGDFQADQREVVATGFGLHIAYGGHDMHGLTVGPDGKIYWSIGDKGIAVTSREGRRFHFPNQGGVMRCDPDGRNFEVYAHGLRNVQEFAFDAYGNIFGVDNDADQPNEKERFVYIVRGMDAGWRCNYQYRGEDYNPWTDERLWLPHFDGQASYILPAIENYVDGPAGFAFNPGTAISSAYLNHFFLTSAPNGFQYAFKVRPDGASFNMEGAHQIGSGIPIVGINFGPDGALYGVDWGGGYPLTQTGAVWKIDVPDSDLSEQRSEVTRLLRENFQESPTEQLAIYLAHVDQRIRLNAQFELVRRNAKKTLNELLDSDSEMARVHAVWGLGQLARNGDSTATDSLLSMLHSPDAEMRAQAARTISDLSAEQVSRDAEDSLAAALKTLLDDKSERVRFMAMLALNQHPTPTATTRLLAISNQLDQSNRYMRFAVSRALAACASGDEMSEARKSSNTVGRLNLVVALRENPDPKFLKPFLFDENSQVASEAARALHDDRSDNARIADLAAALPITKHTDEVFVRRALNANFRRGGGDDLQRVIQFIGDPSNAKKSRLEALQMLTKWKQPDLLDRVDGRRRPPAQQRVFDAEMVATELSKLALADDPQIQASAIRAARGTGVLLASTTLRNLAQAKDIDIDLRIEALQSLEKQGDAMFPSLLQGALKDKQPLRMAAAEMLVRLDPSAAETHLLQTLQSTSNLRERQHALAQLGLLSGKRSAGQLISMLQQLATGELSDDIALDVLDAAQQRENDSSIGAALATTNAAVQEASSELRSPLRKFIPCREGGDPDAGEVIFKTNLIAQCIRCHRIGEQGSNVGPDLRGIASKKDRDYLLRSIIAPSADIDPKYQTESFLMFSGQIFQGLVIDKTDDETVIVDSQGKEIRLDNEEIDVARKNQVSIMPEMVEVLSRQQIRDLVAFLASLKS